jgi:hypothetical protein
MQKRHHTIPRCYLKNFSDNDGFVWVLDAKDNIYKQKPKNILVENNFYTITFKNGAKNLVVEDTLANIESAYATIFENKITKNQFFTADERALVSIFIAAMLLRTKLYREYMRSKLKHLIKSMEDWKIQFGMNPKAREFIPVMPGGGATMSLNDVKSHLNNLQVEHSANILISLPETAQLIFDMKWSILENTDAGFITSDAPVVLLRPASIMKYGPEAIGSQPGLKCMDIELTLPLSKSKLLLAGWILEEDSCSSVPNDVAQNINSRTIAYVMEKVIADSAVRVNNIKAKYVETAH